MQNFRKIQWIVIENFPDARTRVNSKVPIPTKVGGPKIPGYFSGVKYDTYLGVVPLNFPYMGVVPLN